jgi:hydroxypyruvate reductase
MIIKNFKELSKNPKKKIALQILEAGLDAAKPQNSLKKLVYRNRIELGKTKIKLNDFANVYLVAFGKAADSMTSSVDSITKIKGGVIVIPKGSIPLVNSKKFKIFKSAHPLPDKTSVRAASAVLRFVKSKGKNDFIIFLVSGGSSALLSMPNGITLSEKISLTRQLLKSGATIQEINCIRKHLSQIKGGRLVENMQCKSVALVMSDVLGDDLSSIASGMTYYDKTTFNDALKILKKYNLQTKIPKNILKFLKHGSIGKIPETPKKSKIKHFIISNNSTCVKMMVKKSKELGISSKSITTLGDVRHVAKNLAKLAPKKKNSAIVFGGEPTVMVSGKGKGGRNQELVLRLLQNLQNSKQSFIIASIGTDGIDGNTKYAGAISENIVSGINDKMSFLKTNNSSCYFQKHGGLVKTGYTHTNLLDIGLIMT